MAAISELDMKMFVTFVPETIDAGAAEHDEAIKKAMGSPLTSGIVEPETVTRTLESNAKMAGGSMEITGAIVSVMPVSIYEAMGASRQHKEYVCPIDPLSTMERLIDEELPNVEVTLTTADSTEKQLKDTTKDEESASVDINPTPLRVTLIGVALKTGMMEGTMLVIDTMLKTPRLLYTDPGPPHLAHK